MYCPNCDAELISNAKACSVCNAVFSEWSTWRPLQQRSNKQSRETVFFGMPKVANAWKAVIVFGLAGPPIGLLTLFGLVVEKEPSATVLHPVALMGAYALGGTAALVAGLAYCGLALAIVYSFPSAKVRIWLGATLGAISGFLGAVVFYGFAMRSASAGVDFILVWISIPAGVAAGLLSGWLLPIGKQPGAR